MQIFTKMTLSNINISFQEKRMQKHASYINPEKSLNMKY